MKKSLKSGFTLAEVLIALGIMGIITAIMIPTLVSGTQNKKHAASLGRSVEAIESGCQSIIQEASERSTDGIFFGHTFIHKDLSGQDSNNNPNNSVGGLNLFDENASRFFNTRRLQNDEANSYVSLVKSFNGSTPIPALANITSRLFVNSKLGAYWGVRRNTTTDSIDTDDPITEYVYVDVNGQNPPNRYGLDIFLFGLTDRCHMIPAGTNRFNGVLSSVPVESNGCSGTNITNGLSCTHRVVRDGYKIEYDK